MTTVLLILLGLYVFLTYAIHIPLYTWVLIRTNAYLNQHITTGSGLLGVKRWYREHYLPPPYTECSDFYYPSTTRKILKESWAVRIFFAPIYFPLSIILVVWHLFDRYLQQVK